MGVKGARTSKAIKVDKWLVTIETIQKDLGDIMKDLTNKLKEFVTTLYIEISNIRILLKVLMMFIWNDS